MVDYLRSETIYRMCKISVLRAKHILFTSQGSYQQARLLLVSADKFSSTAQLVSTSDVNNANAAPLGEPHLSNDSSRQKRALLHASLLTASEPLSLEQLQQVLELDNPEAVEKALADLSHILHMSHLGVIVEQVAQGYRLVIEPQVGHNLAPLLAEKGRRSSGLSQAALETLALIAYHQPVTRSQLEQIRAISCASTLETLQERRLITVVGQGDSIGKPRLFGTTKVFLLEFGLHSLDDLPALERPQAFVRS